MGKWSTYRRKGSAPTPLPSLPPPEPPALSNIDDYLVSENSLPLGEGLSATLYSGPTETGPWTLYETTFYTVVTQWELISELPTGYYVATNTGNGTTTLGESAYSAPFDNS